MVHLPFLDPWDWYIYSHENYHTNQPNAGKYTSPMDGMGNFKPFPLDIYIYTVYIYLYTIRMHLLCDISTTNRGSLSATKKLAISAADVTS